MEETTTEIYTGLFADLLQKQQASLYLKRSLAASAAKERFQTPC
jgi:hypothetical protein